MLIDLHIHTSRSDGAWAPTAVIAAAARVGLGLVAITDHDTLDGIDEAVEAGAEYGVKVVPGVELSAHDEGVSLHLLGYCFDPAHEGLRRVLANRSRERRDRLARMAERLAGLGLQLDFDEVLAEAGTSSPGRPHLARVMVRHGLVPDFDQAFRRYLAHGAPAYVRGNSLAADDGIRIIHEAGGFVSLAHPGVEHLDDRVARVARMGLDGLEVYHVDHGQEAVRKYRRMAENLGLVETGGSDFHVPSRKSRRGMGWPRLAEEIWTRIEESAARRRDRQR